MLSLRHAEESAIRGKDGERERWKERAGGNLAYNNAGATHGGTVGQRERERTPTVGRKGGSLDTAELVSGVSLLI